MPRELNYSYETAPSAVFTLMQRYSGNEEQHPLQVQKLAGILLDALTLAYPCTDEQRLILSAAALLHDIGQYYGKERHHKNSMAMILNAALPGIDTRTQELIALTARYHRRALPDDSHDLYRNQTLADRIMVNFNAGLLRIADALDRGQCGNVLQLTAYMPDKYTLNLTCVTEHNPVAEVEAVEKKSDMLEKLCQIKTCLTVLKKC